MNAYRKFHDIYHQPFERTMKRIAERSRQSVTVKDHRSKKYGGYGRNDVHLTPSGYFLWGFVKNTINKNKY